MRLHEINNAVVIPNVSSEVKEFQANTYFMNDFNELPEVIKASLFPFLLMSPSLLCTRQADYTEGIRGLKIHPSITRTAINDKKWEDIFKIASYRELPILVHCGRDPLSHISYLIDASENNPGNIFIGAHLGGNASELINEALILVEKANLDNLYLDTSAVKLPSLIDRAIKMIGAEKIIFGSDEPYNDLRVSLYIAELLLTKTEEGKELIMGLNMLRLLGEVT